MDQKTPRRISLSKINKGNCSMVVIIHVINNILHVKVVRFEVFHFVKQNKFYELISSENVNK